MARLSIKKVRSRREIESEEGEIKSYIIDPKLSDLSMVRMVKKAPDELWIAEKFQSNSEIAGSPRNSFRASLERIIYGGRALKELGA